MPARKYMCTFEASFKLHSGTAHEEIITKADGLDEAWRRGLTGALAFARRYDGVILGMVLKDAVQGWQPVIAGVDVPN